MMLAICQNANLPSPAAADLIPTKRIRRQRRAVIVHREWA
jgi:hypothetical protein